jgi:hypothetical protein
VEPLRLQSLGRLRRSLLSLFHRGGLATYESPVNVGVTTGSYYILRLLAPVATNMGLALESAQGLPFTTADGNLQVLDGGANGQVVQNGWLNGILPPFSVAARDTGSPLPEPASLSWVLLDWLRSGCDAASAGESSRFGNSFEAERYSEDSMREKVVASFCDSDCSSGTLLHISARRFSSRDIQCGT